MDTVKDRYMLFTTANPPEFADNKLVDSLLALHCDTSIIRIHFFNCASLSIHYDILFKAGNNWNYNGSDGYSAKNLKIQNTELADTTAMNPKQHIFMLGLGNGSSGIEENNYFLVVKGKIVKSLNLSELHSPIYNKLIEPDLKFFASIDKFFLQRRRPWVVPE